MIVPSNNMIPIIDKQDYSISKVFFSGNLRLRKVKINPLIEIVQDKSQSPLLRERAALKLGQTHTNKSLQFLIKTLEDHTPDFYEVICGIAKGLSDMGIKAKQAVPELLEIVNNKQYIVLEARKSAIEALIKIDPKNTRLIDSLIKISNDPLEFYLGRLARTKLRLVKKFAGIEQRKEINIILNKSVCNESSKESIYIMGRAGLSRTIVSGKYEKAFDNYTKAFHYFIDNSNQRVKPTSDDLITLHKLVMRELPCTGLYDAIPGLVRGSNPFIDREFCSKYKVQSRDVPEKLKQFFKWMDDNYDNPDTLLFAAETYKRLIVIHPFYDGNGRTVRLFVDWILKGKGYFMPIYPENYTSALVQPVNEIKNQIKKAVVPV